MRARKVMAVHDEQTARAVARMQQYIAEHLHQNITLAQLAHVAGYSNWHAAKVFRELTGNSPAQYIRLLRLTGAALKLRDGEDRVLEVALQSHFETHEGFTRAFCRTFGMPPATYSRTAPPVKLFMPDSVYHAFRMLKRSENSMDTKQFPSAVFVSTSTHPARKLMLYRGKQAEDYMTYCQEVGCDMWPVLCSVKEALYEPAGMWLPDHLIEPGTSRYVQAVELPADYAGPVPEGFSLIDLPACDYLVFRGEPFLDDEFCEAVQVLWAYIERFDPAPMGYQWAPAAGPRIQLSPTGERGCIEALPVRAQDSRPAV